MASDKNKESHDILVGSRVGDDWNLSFGEHVADILLMHSQDREEPAALVVVVVRNRSVVALLDTGEPSWFNKMDYKILDIVCKSSLLHGNHLLSMVARM